MQQCACAMEVERCGANQPPGSCRRHIGASLSASPCDVGSRREPAEGRAPLGLTWERLQRVRLPAGLGSMTRPLIVEIEDEWGAPWTLVVAMYIYKMENTGEAQSIERCRVNLTAEGQPPMAADVLEEPSDSEEEFFDTVQHLREPLPEGETGYVHDGKPSPYEIVHAEEVMVGVPPRGAIRRSCRVRGHCCGGRQAPRKEQKPFFATAVTAAATVGLPAVAREPSRGAAAAHRLLPAPQKMRGSGRSGLTTLPEPQLSLQGALRSGGWEYEINYSVPWLMQKILRSKICKYLTTVELDASKQVMVTTMRNISPLVGCQITERTTFTAISATRTSWERHLRVDIVDWLPMWVERKSVSLFHAGCKKSCGEYRGLLANLKTTAPDILRSSGSKSGIRQHGQFSPGTADFLKEIGVAPLLRDDSVLQAINADGAVQLVRKDGSRQAL
eukprot:COSAG05_NODE_87_length_20404_cov_42.272051_24_plen_445_part_00